MQFHQMEITLVIKIKNTAYLVIALSKKVKNLDSLRDENGKILPADMEFSFKNGKLALLQIRPFVESQSALTNPYLTKLDSGTTDSSTVRVPLNGVPSAK